MKYFLTLLTISSVLLSASGVEAQTFQQPVSAYSIDTQTANLTNPTDQTPKPVKHRRSHKKTTKKGVKRTHKVRKTRKHKVAKVKKSSMLKMANAQKPKTHKTRKSKRGKRSKKNQFANISTTSENVVSADGLTPNSYSSLPDTNVDVSTNLSQPDQGNGLDVPDAPLPGDLSTDPAQDNSQDPSVSTDPTSDTTGGDLIAAGGTPLAYSSDFGTQDNSRQSQRSLSGDTTQAVNSDQPQKNEGSKGLAIAGAAVAGGLGLMLLLKKFFFH
jgi:hypothetical protein